MKVLITGSREWTDHATIREELKRLKGLYGLELIIIHGECDQGGADIIADEIAKNLGIQRIRFPANWKGYGRSAGYIRNRFMFDFTQPDLVLAFPVKGSIGTKDMITYARSKNVKVLNLGHPMYPS